MAETKVSCFRHEPGFGGDIRTAVSLHGHTNRSKESLYFLPQMARKIPMLHAALQKQCRKSRRPVDFVRAYWTPPLSPKLAHELETNQIEKALGLMSLVSLTDHDTIEAPVSLRTSLDAEQTPLSLEWSVPFGATVFHLGVHNLPPDLAQGIVADLAEYTQTPSDGRLIELLAMLDQFPEVLVVFNHPLWNQSEFGKQRDPQVLDRFLRRSVEFLHAFEFNATRNPNENDRARQLAVRWQRPLVSGGDRHGCEPSGALNLTGAQSFAEFVGEIRLEQRSHVLIMPQYSEPLTLRTTRTLLNVIRYYPEFPVGSRRWDERIFHPDDEIGEHRPLSSFWKAPPAYIERIFSVIRLLENAAMQRVLGQLFPGPAPSDLPAEISSEAAL